MTQVDNCYYTFRNPIQHIGTDIPSHEAFPYSLTPLESIRKESYFNNETNPYPHESESSKIFNKNINISHSPNYYARQQIDYNQSLMKPYTAATLEFYKNFKYASSIFHKQAVFLSFNTTLETSWNYLPSYKISNLGSYHGIPVVSHHSKLLYDKFDNDISIFSHINLKDNYLATSKLFWANDTIFLHQDQSVKTLFKELYFSTIWNSSEETAHQFTSSKKVIKTFSPCSGPNYDFKLTTLTANQLNKNSGAFVPVLVPIQYMSPHQAEIVDAYFFTFYYNLPVSKVTKYSKPRIYIKKFIKECFTLFGASFYDEDYANKLKSYHLKEYADSGYPILLAKFFQQNDLKINPTSNIDTYPCIPSENYSNFFSYTKLPDNFLKDQIRLDAKEARYSVALEQKSLAFNKSLKAIVNLKAREERLIKDIEYCEKRIINLKKTLADLQLSASNYNDVRDFCTSVNSFLNIAPILNKRKNIMQSQKESLLLSSPNETDQTYINLMKKFDLHSISLSDSSGKITTYDSFNLGFNLALTQDQEINSVIFSTKEPSRIKVSGSGNEEVVGGPYIIWATKNKITISLKDTNSFFGWDYNSNVNSNTDSIPAFLHPHASGTNLSSVYSYNATTCLGEAYSILYKAFENKSLKEIFIAVNVWLSSANRTDAWGKKYKYFISYQDYLDSLNFQDISEEMFEDFEYPFQDYLTFEPSSSVVSNDAIPLPALTEPQESNDTPRLVYQPYSTVFLQNESET